MKELKHFSLCLLAFFCFGMGVRGEDFRTDINPALLYYQAFILAPDLPKADHDYLFVGQDWRRGEKLPDRFGELVGRYGQEFRLVRQAARAAVPCDWGIDMSPGPHTLLPQFARCKAIAQVARLRAMWALQQGRQEDARQDLIGAFALGRNSARDAVLIGVLVEIAIENIVCSTVAENFFQFSPQTLKELAAGFEAAPARGTVAASIGQEETAFADWLIRKISKLQSENPGNESKVLAEIRELVSFLETPEEGAADQARSDSWDRVIKSSGGTSAGVLKLVRDEKPFYQRLATIMALPQKEYESQAKAFRAEIQNSSNPFISITFPAFEKCREKEFSILAELAMVQAAVAYKLHGEAGLRSVPDPFGDGPFALRRFMFEGVDRGFELTSAYEGRGFQEVMIFVEKDGPPFRVNWKNAGQALPKSAAAR